MIHIDENRLDRFKKVASNRQANLTILLENVHDIHNIGAVLRSCDSVGIDEIYILYTDHRLVNRGLTQNHGSSTGISKWMKVNYFVEMAPCMAAIKSKYTNTVGTLLDKKSKSLYDFDFTSSVCLVFGNEKVGITPELQAYLDASLIIPQVGFAKSLNISVACAVTLYEVLRQRLDRNSTINKSQQKTIVNRYCKIHKNKKLNKRNNQPKF